MKKLKAAGITPIVAGGGDKWPMHFYWSHLAIRIGGKAAFDAALRGEGKGFADDDLREGRRAVQGSWPTSKPFQAGFLGATYPQSAGQFGDGKGAMMLMLNGLLNTHAANAADKTGIPDDKLGWFPFPTVPGGKGDPGDTLGGLNGWLVTKGAPKEAVDFLKFFSDAGEPAHRRRARLLHPGRHAAPRRRSSNPLLRTIAENVGRSKYHQIFYDQMLGPVGRRRGQRHLGRSRGRARSTPAEAAAGRAAGLAAGELTREAMRRARVSALERHVSELRCHRVARTPDSPAGGAGSTNPARRSADAWRSLLLFLPPALLLFTLFVVLPMGEAAWYIFYNWNGYGTPDRVRRLAQFRAAVRQRAPSAPRSSTTADHPVSLPCSCRWRSALAVLLADRMRGTNGFRLIFFLPYILAEIAAGLIWRFVYDGDYGLLAKLCEQLRRRAAVRAGRSRPGHVRDPGRHRLEVLRLPHDAVHRRPAADRPQRCTRRRASTARPAGRLPPRHGAAARLDIRLSVFFAIVGSLQLFDLIMPLTKGGPSNSTQTMVTFLYTSASRACRSASAARSAWCCS